MFERRFHSPHSPSGKLSLSGFVHDRARTWAARQHFIFPAQLALSFPSEQMTTSEVLQADPEEVSLQEA